MATVVDETTATLIAAILAASLSAWSIWSSRQQFAEARKQLAESDRQRADFEKDLRVAEGIHGEKRQHLYRQLEEFYDPIYAMLTINKTIFDRIGPGSLHRESNRYPYDENVRLWNELVEAVIIPNNREVCSIVCGKLHLLGRGDTLAAYMEFTLHARAYDVFRRGAYEAYREFRFPQGFQEHVAEQRARVHGRLGALTEEP